MVVSGDPVGTNANWRRVRSLRIGMVLRGPSRSAPDAGPQTFYPLGAAPASAGGADGGAMSSSADPGSVFTPAVDGRFRQVVTFTVHLRNDQGL
jgi:type IV pilus assembly protein PilW